MALEPIALVFEDGSKGVRLMAELEDIGRRYSVRVDIQELMSESGFEEELNCAESCRAPNKKLIFVIRDCAYDGPCNGSKYCADMQGGDCLNHNAAAVIMEELEQMMDSGRKQLFGISWQPNWPVPTHC